MIFYLFFFLFLCFSVSLCSILSGSYDGNVHVWDFTGEFTLICKPNIHDYLVTRTYLNVPAQGTPKKKKIKSLTFCLDDTGCLQMLFHSINGPSLKY